MDMDKDLRGVVYSKCLYMLMVWGKETEWRMKLGELQTAFGLEDQLLLQQLLSAHGPSARSAGKLVWKALASTVKYMTTVDRSWCNRHLHYRIGRAYSWLPLLQKFGVLSKTASGRLTFGSEETYQLQPYNDGMLHTFQCIERFYVVHFDLYGPAEDVVSYETYTKKVVNASAGMVFGDPYGYICRSSARSAQASLRHAAGCLDFQVPNNFSCDRFVNVFPDQAQHVADFKGLRHIRRPPFMVLSPCR